MRFTETRTGKYIETTNIPGHVRPVLIVGDEKHCYRVATFSNEWQAQRFNDAFRDFFGALGIEEERE